MFYLLFRFLARISLRLFFRRIEVQGADAIPTGPILLVSNHTNSLVDPLIPLINLPRRLTLTGKNVLKKNPLLSLISRGLGSISFHRTEDIGKGANPRENVRSMQRCREVLVHGGAICMFPEGVSHSDLNMRPFRGGAARLALDFVRRDKNIGNLSIVPMGLLYSSKGRFRSNVWIRFGPPIDAGQWVAGHPDKSADALTERIRAEIEALTLGYQNRREMLVLHWANDIVATSAQMPPMLGATEPSVSESFERLRRLQFGYRTLETSHGSEISSLASRISEYRAQLKHRGIEPAEVYLPINPLRALFFLLRELELIVLGAPIVLFGIINHLPQYLLVKLIARRLSVDRDHWATNVIYPGMVIFPLFYFLQVAMAFLFLPVLWAALYAIALPYTGYYAVLYSERAGGARRRAGTFIYFLFHPKIRQSLASEGRQIVDSVLALSHHIRQEGHAS